MRHSLLNNQQLDCLVIIVQALNKKLKTPYCWPFVTGIHCSSVDSPNKGIPIRNAFPCHYVIISMAYGKKDVTPLLTQWSYVFLALTHLFVEPIPIRQNGCKTSFSPPVGFVIPFDPLSFYLSLVRTQGHFVHAMRQDRSSESIQETTLAFQCVRSIGHQRLCCTFREFPSPGTTAENRIQSFILKLIIFIFWQNTWLQYFENGCTGFSP